MKKQTQACLKTKYVTTSIPVFNSAHWEENTMRCAGRTLKTRATYLNNALTNAKHKELLPDSAFGSKSTALI